MKKEKLYPSLIITENIAFRKRYLVKRLKGLALADHSVINVLMGSKHCWGQHGTTIFHFLHDFEINWKKSALVTSEVVRLFVNTLSPDLKYSCRKMQIFLQQLQTLLSQEEKRFRWFFIVSPKCAWNLEHSEKKEEYPSLINTEIISSERDVYLSV